MTRWRMSSTGLEPHPDGEWIRFKEPQQIVDFVMREMALRHGASRRRDFEVASLVIESLIGKEQTS